MDESDGSDADSANKRKWMINKSITCRFGRQAMLFVYI